MVDDIAPPKLKKGGRKRVTSISSKTLTLREKYTKAKRSAKQILKSENRKEENKKKVIRKKKKKTNDFFLSMFLF